MTGTTLSIFSSTVSIGGEAAVVAVVCSIFLVLFVVAGVKSILKRQ